MTECNARYSIDGQIARKLVSSICAVLIEHRTAVCTFGRVAAQPDKPAGTAHIHTPALAREQASSATPAHGDGPDGH